MAVLTKMEGRINAKIPHIPLFVRIHLYCFVGVYTPTTPLLPGEAGSFGAEPWFCGFVGGMPI